jgi:hypothetical protein
MTLFDPVLDPEAETPPSPPIPERLTVAALQEAVQRCRACELVTLTTHPSAILRQQGASERAAAMEQCVADLAGVARWLGDR